jgi:parallel beta-helix repeat protein
MKYIVLVIVAFFCSPTSAKATNYYFSTSSGDDSRSAAQAQNPTTPWKTVKKLNSIFNSLAPGDSVLFRRGEIFYGAIITSKSGTAVSPIVISAYGKGDKPVITSLVRLSKWTSLGNGVWESHNSALGTELNMLLLNGEMQEMGRYPNADAGNKGYLKIDSFDGKLSITDLELAASPNWTGAEVVIRKNRWAIDRSKIKLHQGATVYYIASSNYEAKADWGYFIQNHIKTLDRIGEWYYNPTNKKVYVYFGSYNPTSYIAEATTLDNLVAADDCSHIAIHSLTLKGANKDSFKIRKGDGYAISECSIMFSGRNGLNISGHANFRIENSSIFYSNSKGIDLPSSSVSPILKNNVVSHSGLFPGMGEAEGSNGTGIQCYGKGAYIEYNKVLYSGYNGISIKLNLSTTKNNFVDGFCSVKDDGGGIYNHNASNKVFTGALITGNIVKNGIGAPQGTDSDISNAEGIYMDDNSNTAEIRDNTVTNCRRGLYLHNTRNVAVVNNIFYDNEVQFYAKHDKNGEPITNLTVKQNIFFAKLPTQMVAQIESRLDDIGNMGSFDHNYYARPLDDEAIFYIQYKNSEGTKVKKLLDLEGWILAYGKDKNSKKSPVTIASYTLQSLASPNMFTAGSFTTTELKIFGNDCNLSWLRAALLDNGHVQVVPSADGSSITMNVGSFSQNNYYILRYSVIGDDKMRIGAFLRHGGKPYKPLTPVIYRKISPKRRDHELLLKPSADQQSGALVLTVDQSHKYYLDNIQLYKADVTVTDPDDHIYFVSNATNKSKTIPLDGAFADIKNKRYTHKVALAPFSSLILFREPDKLGILTEK